MLFDVLIDSYLLLRIKFHLLVHMYSLTVDAINYGVELLCPSRHLKNPPGFPFSVPPLFTSISIHHDPGIFALNLLPLRSKALDVRANAIDTCTTASMDLHYHSQESEVERCIVNL